MESADTSDPVDVTAKDISTRIQQATSREEKDAATRALVEEVSQTPILDQFRLLDHRWGTVREIALKALVKSDATMGCIAARAALGDPSRWIRNVAAEVLAAVGTKMDVHRLTVTLAVDEAWLVRASAADSLGSIGGESVHIALAQALKGDPHPVVRREAAVALASAKDIDIIPDLERVLEEEKDEQVILGLRIALYRLGQRERLAELLEFLHSDDAEVRNTAVNALTWIIDPEDGQAALLALNALLPIETDPEVREDAKVIIDDILRDLAASDSPTPTD